MTFVPDNRTPSSDAFRRARLNRNLQALARGAGVLAGNHAARLKRTAQEAREQALATGRPRPVPARHARGRAAVVCWDLGHNPVGRAYVLYRLLEKDWDVDLVGPMWARYGQSLWKPLAGEELNIRSFRCTDIDDFVPKAEILAAARAYDIVYVCKPRLPSLYLGALIKESSDCPMIVDVDDHELSFFANREPATLEDVRQEAARALVEPYEELATRYAQSLIPSADAVTVSNIALRDAFGGHIVRHARDEQAFRVDPAARADARARLGIADDEYALMFIGTPRPHKGVGEVARALHELDDPTLVFHIVGTLTDARLRETLAACTNARVVFHPDCPFDQLPVLLAGADLVPLIQDTDHEISRYQIPAKVSDALSLGVPVLASATPPLADLIAEGAVTAVGEQGLAAAIRAMRADAAPREAVAARARQTFLGELSLAVNRARLEGAIAEAIEQQRSLSDTWSDALELLRDEYTRRRRETLGTAVNTVSPPAASRPALPVADRPEAANDESRKVVSLRSRLGRSMVRRMPHILRSLPPVYDIAFFWKQNDSGLYGRRSDMVARHLASSGRVNRLLHFDAPLRAGMLEQNFVPGAHEPGGQQDLIVRNLFDRRLELYDAGAVRHRTFVGVEPGQSGHLLGEPLPERRHYAQWVRKQIEAAGMRPERTWAWFCPVIWDAPTLVEEIGFAGVVSDLIDDQRAWGGRGDYGKRLNDSYRRTLAVSDVTFANCDALAQSMSEHVADVTVVPNGAERFMERPAEPVPAPLADIRGPIAGYVGNLRDRIDWSLLHEVVAAMPNVTFVLAGPAGDNLNAQSLARYPNVRLPGVVPYEQLPAWLRRFDVGLLPHLNNRLTARMNPLKVYNYFACGLPTVSTEVQNLGVLGDGIRTAADAAGFIAGISAALQARPDTTSAGWQRTMDTIAWDSRVATMLDTLDAHVGARLPKVG